MIYSEDQSLSNLIKHKELLQTFCNIRDIKYIDNVDELPVNLSIFPNYDILGKKLRADINEFRNIIKEQNALELFKHFIINDSFTFKINDTSYEVHKNEIKLLQLKNRKKSIFKFKINNHSIKRSTKIIYYVFSVIFMLF